MSGSAKGGGKGAPEEVVVKVDTGVEEEPSEGTLAPSDELEAALREATEAVDARRSEREGGDPGENSGEKKQTADKLTIAALAEELQSLKQEYEALDDRHVRLQADFENFRRRGLRERQEAHNYGHQNLVKDLLATVDNLERAIQHSAGSDGGDLQSLLQGIALVHREFLGALAKHGVSKVEAAGKPFDPSVHEAMGQIEAEDVPANTVVQVLQEGYQLRERMLRPARVMVSRGGESEVAAESPDEEDA